MEACTGAVSACENACLSPGYAVVAVQEVERFYDFESAFVSGTVFPDLCIPRGKYGPKEIFQA